MRRVRQAGVRTVGAGANRQEAHALQIFIRKNIRIGFLAYLGLAPPLLPESDAGASVAMGSVQAIGSEVRAARPRALTFSVPAGSGTWSSSRRG